MSFFNRLELAKQQSITEAALKLGQPPLDTLRHNLCRMQSHPGDTEPSMKVYDDTNSFYCFGCKAGGSTVDYIMGTEGIGLYEAVRKVERLFNLKIIRSGSSDRTNAAKAAAARIKGRFSRPTFDAQSFARHAELQLRVIVDRIRTKSTTPEGRAALETELGLVFVDIDRAVEEENSEEELTDLFDFYTEKLLSLETSINNASLPDSIEL